MSSCSKCGAPIKSLDNQNCDYCGALIKNKEGELIEETVFNSYQEFLGDSLMGLFYFSVSRILFFHPCTLIRPSTP